MSTRNDYFVFNNRTIQFSMFSSMLQKCGYDVTNNSIKLFCIHNIPRTYIHITCFNCGNNTLSYKIRYILDTYIMKIGKEIFLSKSICSPCVEKVFLLTDL